MSEEIESKWECIIDTECAEGGHLTSKLKVEGGYLYVYQLVVNDKFSSNMCFVPDVDLTRYQAHLRDAYSKGFEDGKADAHAQYVQCKKPS